MGKQCAYRYGSGDRCIYTGCENEGEMCSAHVLLSGGEVKRGGEARREADRATYAKSGMPFRRPARGPVVHQPSRVQAAKVLLPRLPPAQMDHTAPWHCEDASCGKCKDKPSYRDYMRGRRQRG